MDTRCVRSQADFEYGFEISERGAEALGDGDPGGEDDTSEDDFGCTSREWVEHLRVGVHQTAEQEPAQE